MFDSDLIVNNQLLSALYVSTYQRLLPHIEPISLTSGRIVHQSYETIRDVYFPQSAIFSLVLKISDSDRSASEIALVGNEGMVGLAAVLGGESNNTSSIVQIPGTALKLSKEIVRQEFNRGEELQQLLLLYTQARLAHVSQIAACGSLHNVEQRFARLLLLAFDCVQQETIPLTQKYISSMLGVRRASVTETAISLQKQDIIRYKRGKIILLDRSKLEAVTCQCYFEIGLEYQRLLRTK